jgi:hypothetical protein
LPPRYLPPGTISAGVNFFSAGESSVKVAIASPVVPIRPYPGTIQPAVGTIDPPPLQFCPKTGFNAVAGEASQPIILHYAAMAKGAAGFGKPAASVSCSAVSAMATRMSVAVF